MDAAPVAARAMEFLEALDETQRETARIAFDDEVERRTWFYWPAPRRGVALRGLDHGQRALVHRLVSSVVGRPAYAKINAIVALEDVLAEMEGDDDRVIRDRDAYFASIFGEPGYAPWGFRFEGHHVSLHVTVTAADVAPTPLFLGANPAAVTNDGRVVVRPLAEEEDVGRSLLLSLPTAQRRRAMIDDRAPDDIVTSNAPLVDHDLGGGVSIADLSGEPAEIASALVRIYAGRTAFPRQLDVSDVHFAWAGSPEAGAPHYYRLAGARFLAEYDNTQNGANHGHAVWRDPADDFGDDTLRRHRAEAHEGRPTE